MKTTAQTEKYLDKLFDHLGVLENYQGTSTPIWHHCATHDVKWKVRPHFALSKQGCPICFRDDIRALAKMKSISTELGDTFCANLCADLLQQNYRSELAASGTGWSVLETYITLYAKIKHVCGNGHENLITPADAKRFGCNICARSRIAKSQTLTEAEYIERLKSKPHIKYISGFVNTGSKAVHLCTKHNHTWEVVCSNILGHQKGCPICGSEGTSEYHRTHPFSGYARKVTRLNGKPIKVQGYEDIAIYLLLEEGYDETRLLHGKSNLPFFQYGSKLTGKPRNYYPDFYYPPNNEIIEVKSDYTFTNDQFIKDKAKAVKAAGFKFRLVLFDGYKMPITVPKNWQTLPSHKITARDQD